MTYFKKGDRVLVDGGEPAWVLSTVLNTADLNVLLAQVRLDEDHNEYTVTPDRLTLVPPADPLLEEWRALAATIANQADALANGKVIGPQYAAVQRLKSNIETLVAWTPDDRS